MGFAAAVLEVLLRLAINSVRLCLLALLLIAEPIVRTVLGGLALLTALTACFFEFTSTPRFPFAGMMAFAVSCILLLMIYYRLMRLLLATGA